MRRLQYAVAVLAAVTIAHPASAQLGGLMKAKGAVEQKAGTVVEKKAENAVGLSDLKPVDAFGAPLTAQSLDTALSAGSAAWTLARAPRDAAVAFNAGQFEYSKPWGLVVLDGTTMLSAGEGPLATTVSFDDAGAVRLTHGATGRPAHARYAFQSYPTLVVRGATPAPLQRAGLGIDVAHRDARAALGVDRYGRVLVVLTRFDALGEIFGSVPFGLTTPEMAGLMLAFGAQDAVMLDGGISAQLLVRDAGGAAHRWPGLRSVPLAVIGRPAR